MAFPLQQYVYVYMAYLVYMDKQPWGRRKLGLVLTIQGELTEKQFAEVERRILKIAEKYNMGYGASDYAGLDMTVF